MLGVVEFGEEIALSLLIGALLGLEREYTKKQEVVGLRTFALISLLGCLLGILSKETVLNLPELPVYGFIGVGLFSLAMYVSNLFKYKEIGMTTTIALLLCYVIGLVVSEKMYTEAVFIAVIITVVMFTKKRLHQTVKNVTHREMLDLIEFLVIIGLIYPFVNNQPPIGLFGLSVNLYSFWLLIVLMSVMNLVGFLGSRMLTTETSMALIGFLGGLMSQKVSCASLSEAYRKTKNLEMVSASFLMTNGSVLVRNLALMALLVTPELTQKLAVPTIAGFIFFAGVGYFKIKNSKRMILSIESPFNVRRAVMLSLKLFAIFLALDLINVYFHQTGYFEQVFFISVFVGGVISGASTIASIAILTSAGQITLMEALVAFGIASISELLVGHITVFWFEESKQVIKHSLVPTVLGALVFAVLLGLMCCT